MKCASTERDNDEGQYQHQRQTDTIWAPAGFLLLPSLLLSSLLAGALSLCLPPIRLDFAGGGVQVLTYNLLAACNHVPRIRR